MSPIHARRWLVTSWVSLIALSVALSVASCSAPSHDPALQAGGRDTFDSPEAVAPSRTAAPSHAMTAPTDDAAASPEFDAGADIVAPASPAILPAEGAPAVAAARAASAAPRHRITLRTDLIDRIKNRATMTAGFDPHAISRHGVSDDADAHISGTIDEVQMTMVAEMMNWQMEREQSMRTLARAIDDGSKLQIAGVWRLWCEHPGRMDHVQGNPIPDYGTFQHATNPDHVFEIHPVTFVGSRSVLSTLRPIGAAYPTKKAREAFAKYESLRCRIEPGTDSITIRTDSVGFNYPEFSMRPAGQAVGLEDGGYAVMAFVYKPGGGEPVVSQPRRMIFVPDSEPARRLMELGPNQKLHVLGMPRIDLGVVSDRARTGTKLSANLPYEIVIVGAYGS